MKLVLYIFGFFLLAVLGGFAFFAISDVQLPQREVTKEIAYDAAP